MYFSIDAVKRMIGGVKRSDDWYKYLFDVMKTAYTGGNSKSAYRKYELYCEIMHEPAFPYNRLMQIYNQVMNFVNEIRNF
jgi:hypothetical protein